MIHIVYTDEEETCQIKAKSTNTIKSNSLNETTSRKKGRLTSIEYELNTVCRD